MDGTPTFHAPIAEQIWDMKYRLKRADGTPVDETIKDTWQRVSKALAQPEDAKISWGTEFYDALRDFKFIPAGRILAGAGTGRDVTLFNCFVMGTIPDSMDGIFSALKEAALTMQQGGGIGYDFSTIRPKGALVKGVSAEASGPLSFMDCWDAMCRTVMSAGSRRGAMMATLRCDHPDVLDFVEAKRDPARLRMFNLSVLCTDDFMGAVEDDADWDLVFNGEVYSTIPARELWDRIMRATYDVTDPGVIFIDRINKANNLFNAETIAATNPCLAAGTLVSTRDGFKPVEHVRPDDEIATIDQLGPVKHTEAHKQVAVFKVSLSDGTVLRATAAHIFHVARGKRFDTDTRLDQLEVGDQVRLAPAHMPDCGMPDIDGSPDDETLGFIVGAAIGDGCMTDTSRSLKIACRRDEPEWIDKLHRTLLQFGEASVTDSTDACVTVNSRRALEILEEIGVARGKSHEKCLPLHLLNSNEEFLSGFLDGLISTDGNIHMSSSNPMVRISSTSRENLMMAKRALSCFGILARVYEEGAKAPGEVRSIEGREVRYNHQGYVLVVLGQGVRTLYERISLTRPSKARRLKKLAHRFSLTGCTWKATIKAIEPDGLADVFDLYEPVTDTWIAEGVVNRGCGEQPLPPYGACLLGSINLAALVRNRFGPKAGIDPEELRALVATAVRMLDNVVDVSRFPLEAQADEARAKRRIGLGVTGLADALAFCGVRYGSPQAVGVTEDWLRVIEIAAYTASAELAEEKGPYPIFDATSFLISENGVRLPASLRDKIRETGLRNSHLTSIAPTGTISLVAGNVSSGIEPIFALEYTRKVLQPDGSRTEEVVEDYAVREWRRLRGDEPLPDTFVTAQDLTPADHIAMQAAAQRYIDSSISKTINCPEDIPFEDFQQVYRDAYEGGCKGCTTYRPNDVTGSVMSVDAPKDSKPEPEKTEADGLLERPEVIAGKTYKIKWPESAHAIYVTVNDAITASGSHRPLEVFINSKNTEHYAWTVALTRMISAVFRRGGDVAFVVEELKAVFDPRGGGWIKGRYVPSVLAAIGGVIERHMVDTGYLDGPESEELEDIGATLLTSPPPAPCPSCGSHNTRLDGGCLTCGDCGYSKCG